ncbi:hypothetical protein GCM10007874_60060 [Labrys miyagiensis]|uniref:Transposase n=1 Tax=Labrys miyagiensis TaxID=346912 RepID=A0ABQ6CXM6_9HYPH|nr:hypothetical protein GCM10007874_60060 [Labrys miyagiensis]
MSTTNETTASQAQQMGKTTKLPGSRIAICRQSCRQPAIAYQMYLPQEWAEDTEGRQKANVPLR